MATELYNKTQYARTGAKDRSVLCSIAGFNTDIIALKVSSQDLPNTQMAFALNGDTYLLDFGEKLSPLTLSGIAIADGCGGSFKNRLNDLYKAHRIGKEPVNLTIGSDTYSAYITGRSGAVSSERPSLFNFSISFLGYRQGSGNSKGSGGSDGSSGDGGTGISSSDDFMSDTMNYVHNALTESIGGPGSTKGGSYHGSGMSATEKLASHLGWERGVRRYATNSTWV